MDARERARKIGAAMHAAIPSTFGDCAYSDEPQEARDQMEAVALAAVRAAYEIDEIGKLVKAALDFPLYCPLGDGCMGEDCCKSGRLRAIAARVREAMGGQT